MSAPLTSAYRVDPNNVFPVRLKRTRHSRGISQRTLAKKIGFHPTAISHFEAGRRLPSLSSLVKIANALDISIDYLLGRTHVY
jgi:transcriptional regulator with XRE-family HTH domain